MTSWGYPTLHTGEIVRVFSQSADQWVNATIANIYVQDIYNFIDVEYKIANQTLRKTLNENSMHVRNLPAAIALHEDDGGSLHAHARKLRTELEMARAGGPGS